MARLTRRSSGLTEVFTSNYGRDDLIQKLGLEFICESCPMTRLMEMID